MSNKFKLSYLTLLVVLAGALIVAPAVTGFAQVTSLTVAPTDPTPGATNVEYEVSFVINSVNYTDAGGDLIRIEFPTETDMPAAISANDVTVKDETESATAVDVTISGDTVIIETPNQTTNTYSDGDTITVTFDTAVGFGNPDTVGNYTADVNTNVEDTWVTSSSYLIQAEPHHFKVTVDSTTVTAGNALGLTITAKKADDTDQTLYEGDNRINFSNIGELPDFRILNFTGGVADNVEISLTNAGINGSAIDVEDDTFTATGSSDPIDVTPAALDSFDCSIDAADKPTTAGTEFANDITVTALDAYGNTKTDYEGEVSWSSSDSAAVLPADYTFVTGDSGTKTFSGSDFALKTVIYGGDPVAADNEKPQTLTVEDSAVGVSASDTVEVEPAAADSLEATADPTSIRADGIDEASLTATAYDEYGNVATGYDNAENNATGEFVVSFGTRGTGGVQNFSEGVITDTLTVTGSSGTDSVEVSTTSDDLNFEASTAVEVVGFTGDDASVTLTSPGDDTLRFNEVFTTTVTLTNTTEVVGINGEEVTVKVKNDSTNTSTADAADTVIDSVTVTTETNAAGDKGKATARLQAPSAAQWATMLSAGDQDLYLTAEYAGSSSYQKASRVTESNSAAISGGDISPAITLSMNTASDGLATIVDPEWSMISVDAAPIDTGPGTNVIEPTPSAVFNFPSALFYWNGTKYLQGDEISSVSPTAGYWFFSSSEVQATDPADGPEGTIADTAADVPDADLAATAVRGAVEISLGDAGWHQISAPFNVGLGQAKVKEEGGSWESFESAATGTSPLVSKYLVDYDTETDGYVWLGPIDENAITVGAQTGYWLETNVADLTLWLPFNPATTPGTPAAFALNQAAKLDEKPAGVSTPPAPPVAPQEAADGLKATAAATADGVTFEVAGADVGSMSVQVFNLSGEQIFSKSANGNSLSWNASVANGVYLYGVSAKVNGTVKPLGIQKLLILE